MNYDVQTIAKINKVENPDIIQPGDLIRIGTIDENGVVWQPPYVEGVVNYEYWKYLNRPQRKITNYHRQIFEDIDLPMIHRYLLEEESRSWDEFGESIAHNINTSGNIEYRGVGDRANQQVVYDSVGNLVTSPENKGSYDYEIPSILNLYKNHLKVDV